MASIVRSDRRLWLTADRRTLVEDGDARAAFLWAASPGAEVSEAEAGRVGYRANKELAEKARARQLAAATSTAAPDIGQYEAVDGPDAAADGDGAKEAAKPADKNMGKPADKAAGKPGTK